MVMDITSRKKAEQELKASEEKYRTIFENIVDVYYETTLEGEILEVSPSIRNFGGFTRDELEKADLARRVARAQRHVVVELTLGPAEKSYLFDADRNVGAVLQFLSGERGDPALARRLERRLP